MKKRIYLFFIIIGIYSQSFTSIQQYVHSFSGTTFATKIGNFKIIGPRQYDDTGKDISVGYKSNSMIELTQYIYPSNGLDLYKHFESYKNSLLTNKIKAKLLITENIKTQGIPGKYSKFEFLENFHGLNQTVYSYLYIYKTKGWFIKLRITCKSDNYISMEKEITDYVARMPFPTIENK